MTRQLSLLATVVFGVVSWSMAHADEQESGLEHPVFFIVHSEIEIDASPEEIWPFIEDPTSWKELPPSKRVSGTQSVVGEKLLVSAGPPEQPINYYVETLEHEPNVRKVILIYFDEHRQGDIGYGIWSLHHLGNTTKAAYDVYALNRSATMTAEEAAEASRRQTIDNQARMDADFVNLKRLVESGETPASARLKILMDDVWQQQLAGSTAVKRQNGVPIDSFEDFTLEAYQEKLEQAATLRRRLEEIDRESLDGDQQLNYDILAFELRDTGADDTDYWLTLDLTAYQAPYILSTAEQVLQSIPIGSPEEAETYLHLLNEYADSFEQLNAKVREQAVRGIRLPKQALPSTREIWRGRLTVSEQRRAKLPGRLQLLSDGEAKQIIERAESIEAERIEIEVNRLLDFTGPEYEAAAPQVVGLGSLPGGASVYRRKVIQHTSLEMSPDEIHELGLKRVEELSSKMAAIRAELGFNGTAREFHDQIRRDPRFVPTSSQDIADRFMKTVRLVEPRLEEIFRKMPAAPWAVARLPAALEAGMTFGYYNPPSPRDPVGTYFFNGSSLEDRNLINAAALIIHELLPGHHFHIALQKENTRLHPLRQNYLPTSYTEGWAEYAGHLGHELGAYDDLYDRYGRYVAEMFLSMRLVVDTGMNAKGWSLEKARETMREHVYNSDLEIETETLRYSSSIPGQALAYRLGMEKILELREQAESELGDAFDVRDFHDVVLGDGAVPLIVLDQKVRNYTKLQLAEDM